MIELDRDVCVYATIVEWQTAGDNRTELELRPLAEAAFDAYSAALNEAYDREREKILAQLIADGVDPANARDQADVLALEVAGEMAKHAAGDALDAPGVDGETSPGQAPD